MRTIKTSDCASPKFKDWLLIASDSSVGPVRTWIIPRAEWTALFQRASKRFNDIAPMGPYPVEALRAIGMAAVDWKGSETNYKWFVREIDKIGAKYRDYIDAEWR